MYIYIQNDIRLNFLLFIYVVQVAIKVQRPDILSRVALDMHLLRILSVPIKALAGLQTDLAGVIDDW